MEHILYRGFSSPLNTGSSRSSKMSGRVIKNQEAAMYNAVKKSNKVAIVGCADSKKLTPIDDPAFEIWGMNNLYPHLPRADRWFEIHEIKHDGTNYYRRGERIFRGQVVNNYLQKMGEWAQKQNCPVYMQQHWEIAPTSTPYPLQPILQKFGNYFTNSVSYMLAMAIMEKYEEIHIYGVDMAVAGNDIFNPEKNEYSYQRPSVEWLLGWCMGAGIKTYVPPEADLLKTRFLYGFEQQKEDAWKKKCKIIMTTMREKRAKLENEIRLKESQIQQYIGAETGIVEINRIWG